MSRALVMTGWIGEHPRDGSDVAHLVLYPAGHGSAGKMRLLAETLGLARSDAGPLPDVDADQTAMRISRDARDVWAGLVLGGTLAAERPVTAELAEVALARGWVVLTVGQDPWDGRSQTLDRWLARSQRLHLGRVQINPNGAQ